MQVLINREREANIADFLGELFVTWRERRDADASLQLG